MNFLNKFLANRNMQDGWKEKLDLVGNQKQIYFYGLPTFFNDPVGFLDVVSELKGKGLQEIYVGHFDFLKKEGFDIQTKWADDFNTYRNQKIHLDFYDRLKNSGDYAGKNYDLSEVLSSMDNFYKKRVGSVFEKISKDMKEGGFEKAGLVFDKKAYPFVLDFAREENIGLYHKRI